MPLEGQTIITDDVSGTVQPSNPFLRFINAAIDVERAERIALIGDAATVSPRGVSQTPSESSGRLGAAIDTVRAFTPVQIGGLLIAAGLTWGLATGKFRFG